MQNVKVESTETQDHHGRFSRRQVITDELLGVVAHDDGMSPYVDLYVEGATVPFDTVNVWKSGFGRRADPGRVLDLVLDRFRTNREEHQEEAGLI